jgi:hypothetical protein
VPLGGRHGLLLFLFGGHHGLLDADPGKGEEVNAIVASAGSTTSSSSRCGGGSGVQEVGAGVEEAPVAAEWVEGIRGGGGGGVGQGSKERDEGLEEASVVVVELGNVYSIP